MRTALLVLALAMLMASGAFAVTASTATIELYPMLNTICAPVIPFEPYNGWGDTGYTGCFSGWADMYLNADWLLRFDAPSGGPLQLNADWDGLSYGILAGEGYQAWVDGYSAPGAAPVKSFSFQGADISDTDLWISLPGKSDGTGGLHYIGINYPVGTSISEWDVIVTDGSTAWTMQQIAWNMDGAPQDWLDPGFIGYDAAAQGPYAVAWERDPPLLYGGQAYQVNTFKPNLALIVPHPAAP